MKVKVIQGFILVPNNVEAKYITSTLRYDIHNHSNIENIEYIYYLTMTTSLSTRERFGSRLLHNCL